MQTLTNGVWVLFAPRRGWSRVAAHEASLLRVLLGHTAPLAFVGAACWYLGITHTGWEIAGEAMRLTPASALPMCILYFLAMVTGVVFLGYMVHWMSATYGRQINLADGVTLISYTATPFFVAGLLGLYPILWLDIAIGVGVALYCIYLLYLGVPILLKIPSERGFLYASAVFAVALVAIVGLLCATVVLWDLGIAPEYTY